MSLAVSWLKLHAYVMLIAQWAQYTAISHHCLSVIWRLVCDAIELSVVIF